MEKSTQNPGKSQGGIVARAFAWFVALFVGVSRGSGGSDPNAERIHSWSGDPLPERKGYFRFTFQREDGQSFSFIIDARPAERMSTDLITSAAKMTLAVSGSTPDYADRGDSRFDIEEKRAEFRAAQEKVVSGG